MSLLSRVRAALTADATVIVGPKPEAQQQAEKNASPARSTLYRTPEEWQREVWDFYDSLGEFRQGITWKANMLSRVRLRAAKKVPGRDEPVIVDSGPANDIVSELANGVGGQALLMSSFGVYLDVPGECYLIGETLPSGKNSWYARSIEEVRPSGLDVDGLMMFEVAEANNRWRKLPPNSMVSRVHRAHKRWHHVADSPARAARTLLRELELLNRHIASQYLSRLASAGIIVFPDEITFPTRPEFKDEPDPFIAEWIEIAAQAIKTPGTASAIVPIPIRVPGEYADKVKLIDFTLKLDEKIIDKRDSALSRLAIELDMPPEALLGTKDVNHWSAWLIDEQGVKIHIAPTAETICDGLTVGYLHPRMIAAKLDPEEWVVWYDPSELILRPDRSQDASDTYDRLELSGAALRREHGFTEEDKPSDEELREIALKMAMLQPVNTFAAMDELGLKTTHDTPPTAPRPPAEQPAPGAENPNGPPNPEDSRAGAAAARLDRDRALLNQAKLMHAVKIEFDGEYSIMHPTECAEHLFSCPVTHATWTPTVNARPGTAGVYECWLNVGGSPIIGQKLTRDTSDMIPSTSFTSTSRMLLSVNGHEN